MVLFQILSRFGDVIMNLFSKRAVIFGENIHKNNEKWCYFETFIHDKPHICENFHKLETPLEVAAFLEERFRMTSPNLLSI